MAKQPLQTLVRHLHQLVGPRESGSADDLDLLARFVKHRDSVAFAALLQRHGPMVRGVCHRLLRQESDMDDAFQATFLVLLRKAHTIRKSRSVGSWLYGVAYRVASRARTQQKSEVRRQRSEVGSQKSEGGRPLESMTGDPGMQAAWRELCAVLDAEVHRLPEKYRAPLVLCYLEGQTRDQTARQLGCPLRTLDRRLEQGRERLRARLARRGITLSAALLTTGLSQQVGVAAVPQALAEQTIQAASGLAAGQTAAGISPKAIVLAEVALKGAVPMQLKVVAGAFLVAAVALGGAGALAHQMLAAKPQAPSEVKDSQPAVGGEGGRTGTWESRPSLRHDNSPVHGVAFSPDGNLIATASKDQTVKLWNAKSYRLELTLRGHANNVLSVAFSPDGKTLASGGYDATKVWDVATGKELITLLAGEHTVALAYSRDGELIATGNQSGVVKLWNVKTVKEQVILEGQKRRISGGLGLLAISVAFSPDGKLLAAGSYDKSVKLWDVPSGKLVTSLRGHSGAVFSIAFSPKGKTLASASDDGTVKLWNVIERKERATLKSDADSALSVAVSPDGNIVAAGVYKKDGQSEVKLWNTATLMEQSALKTHTRDGVISLTFSPDGKMLLGACGNFYAEGSKNRGEVKVWEFANRK